MRKMMRYLLFFGCLLFIAIVSYIILDDPKPDEKTVRHTSENIQQNTKIIDQMILDEKIGQLIFAGIDGTTLTHETMRLINEYKVGGIILFANNIESWEQTTVLLAQLKHENSRNKLPLFLGVDQEGGRVERLSEAVEKLPAAEVIGKKDDLRLSFEFGKLLSKQVQLYGFNLNFAPVLDINSNPNNPVIGDRSFGNDPVTVGNHGIQVMKAMQTESIIPAIKHFPGHGDTDTDSHTDLPQVDKSLDELRETELKPFKDAIDAGADIVMTAHILLPKIDPDYPASISKHLIHDILREELSFDGVVMTDDMTMAGLTNYFDIGEAAVKSVQAGSDIILVAHNYEMITSVFDALKVAVKNGDITEDRLNESLTRIIDLKTAYRLDQDKTLDFSIKDVNSQIDEMIKVNELK